MLYQKPKVVVFGGSGRSGSTFLELVLGQIDGTFTVGELRHIWERSFCEDQLCGCGLRFSQCAFWRNVKERAFGFSPIDIEQVRLLKSQVDHFTFIPFLLFPRIRPPKWMAVYREYSQIILSLYIAIRNESGCDIIVDSSKDPSYVYLLNAMANEGMLDLAILHLVRDSRAVAYSWQRKKKRPEIYWQDEFMPVYSIQKSAFEWTAMNFLMSMLAFYAGSRYIFLRYEDFVNSPQNKIDELTKSLRIPTFNLYSVSNGKQNHTVSGNPVRFEQGPIRVKPDREWLEKLPKNQKRLITLMTLPLLVLYKYL